MSPASDPPSCGSPATPYCPTGGSADATLPPLVHVVQAAGGADISVCLDVCGRVFSWGWSASGRLGRGGYGDEAVPGVVEKLKGVRAVQVRCSLVDG